MRHGFRASGPGFELRLEQVERSVLADLLQQLLTWIAPDPAPDQEDPLAQMVGISPHAERPEDPALLRLFPDAYADDEAAASDFRRFTEVSLRREKSQRARTALDALTRMDGRGRVALDRDEGQAWLLSLNDLRLVIGTRLGITDEDDDEEAADPGRPVAYDWLTWLQSTLVEAMLPSGSRLR